MKASIYNPLGIDIIEYKDATRALIVRTVHDDVTIYFPEKLIDLKVGDAKTVIPLSALVDAFALVFNDNEFHMELIDHLARGG